MSLLLLSPDCVYCGMTATTRDHFIPLRFETEELRMINFELPCCNQCNTSAGSKVFLTWYDKQEFLWNIAQRRNRFDLIALRPLAPRVAEALRQHEAGRNTARLVAEQRIGLCITCGMSIANARRDRQNAMKVPHDRRVCSRRCLSRLHYDDARRRTNQYRRDVDAGEFNHDVKHTEKRGEKPNRPHISDLWRK